MVSRSRRAKTRRQRKSLMERMLRRRKISNLRSDFSCCPSVVVPEEPAETHFAGDFIQIRQDSPEERRFKPAELPRCCEQT